MATPNWPRLSEELRALVSTEGPLSSGELGGRYEKMFKKQLNFHGNRLKDLFANGDVEGLRFNPSNPTGQS